MNGEGGKFPQFAPLDPHTPAPPSLLGVPPGFRGHRSTRDGSKVELWHNRPTAHMHTALQLCDEHHLGLIVRITNTMVEYEVTHQVAYGEIRHIVNLDLK